jgi:hypothetical protein
MRRLCGLLFISKQTRGKPLGIARHEPVCNQWPPSLLGMFQKSRVLKSSLSSKFHLSNSWTVLPQCDPWNSACDRAWEWKPHVRLNLCLWRLKLPLQRPKMASFSGRYSRSMSCSYKTAWQGSQFFCCLVGLTISDSVQRRGLGPPSAWRTVANLL